EPMYGQGGEKAGKFLGYRGVGREVTERKREERLVSLEHAVTRYLAEAKNKSSALRAVMRAICETENWGCARYFHVDETANVVRCEETWSAGEGPLARFAEVSRGATFARGQGLVGHVWQSGEATWIADVSQDPR